MVVLHWRLALCYGMGKLCGVLIPLDLEEMRKAGILTPSHGRGEFPPPPLGMAESHLSIAMH